MLSIISYQRLLATIVFASCFQFILQSQCPPPGFPSPSNTCLTAPILCQNIDGYCATINNSNDPVAFPGCGNNWTLNNDEWFAFYAGSTSISIQIIPNNCAVGPSMGLQGGIYSGCGGAVMDVQCSCTVNPFTLFSASYVIGQIYYFVINGCNGNVCDFEINVLSGSTIPLPPNNAGPINGSTLANPGTVTNYNIAPPTGATIYNWSLVPSIGTLNPNNSNLSIAWNAVGIAQLCVMVSNQCSANPTPSCLTITSQIPCTNLIDPLNGSTNIDVNADLAWVAPPGNPTGYKVTVGTSPGSNNILNNLDVGNVTIYDPGTYPFDSPIYVKIIPYSTAGEAQGCPEEVFATGGCIISPSSSWIGVYHVWDLPQNWSLGYVPNACTKVEIPSGIVLIPITSPARCRTLELQLGAILEVPIGSSLHVEY